MREFSNRVGAVLAAAALCGVAWGGQFFVAPDGTPTGDGSRELPWDLATALKPHKAIQPMDTVWVRGGVYKGGFVGKLTGGPNAPVILRAYPGERAILDGAGFSPAEVLSVQGSNAWYWGLEVMNSDPKRRTEVSGSNTDTSRGGGISMAGVGTKVINCVIHDAGTAVGQAKHTPDMELYGTVAFNNGWRGPDRMHGPGIYTQNATGEKVIRDNILFNSYWSGLQLYGSENSQLNNYLLEGNVSFNGRWLVGGGAPAQNIRMVANLLYKNTAEFYYSNKFNKNLILAGNYMPVLTSAMYWDQVEARGNTFLRPTSTEAPLRLQSSVGSTPKSWVFEGNTYVTGAAGQVVATVTETDKGQSRSYSFDQWKSEMGFEKDGSQVVYPKGVPPTPNVVVRRNLYDPSRGHVVIYNWPHWEEVEVDLGLMNPQPGDKWVLRNVQNYLHETIEGVYEGKPIRVKMTGWTVAVPIGETAPLNPVTFPEFGVFVVTIERRRPAVVVSGADPASVGTASPGSIVVSKVTELHGARVVAEGPVYSERLGGVRVEIVDREGGRASARLLWVNQGEVAWQVPEHLAFGPVTVTISHLAMSYDGGSLTLQYASPSLFTADGSGQGPALGYVQYGSGETAPLSACHGASCEAIPIEVNTAGAAPVLMFMGTALRGGAGRGVWRAQVGGVEETHVEVREDLGYPGLDWLAVRLQGRTFEPGKVPVRVLINELQSNQIEVNIKK